MPGVAQPTSPRVALGDLAGPGVHQRRRTTQPHWRGAPSGTLHGSNNCRLAEERGSRHSPGDRQREAPTLGDGTLPIDLYRRGRTNHASGTFTEVLHRCGDPHNVPEASLNVPSLPEDLGLGCCPEAPCIAELSAPRHRRWQPQRTRGTEVIRFGPSATARRGCVAHRPRPFASTLVPPSGTTLRASDPTDHDCCPAEKRMARLWVQDCFGEPAGSPGGRRREPQLVRRHLRPAPDRGRIRCGAVVG
jgi:hypothetical protein